MNTEELKQIFIRLKNDKKSLIIIFIGIVGMLLIMFSGDDDNKAGQNNNSDSHIILSETQLADEVERFIENITGAGKTRVILTFESYEETVYAKDKDEKYSNNSETDINSEYVIIDNGDSEAGLKIKVISPKIRGVAVICQGGNEPTVKAQIISALSALFDISTNKISVAQMAT